MIGLVFACCQLHSPQVWLSRKAKAQDQQKSCRKICTTDSICQNSPFERNSTLCLNSKTTLIIFSSHMDIVSDYVKKPIK